MEAPNEQNQTEAGECSENNPGASGSLDEVSTFSVRHAQTESNVGGHDNAEMGAAFSSENEIPSTSSVNDDWPEFDLGRFVGKSACISTAQKREILQHCWVPHESYDFRKDSNDTKRSFRHKWLKQYEPWLTYSKKLKGALCMFCVLFPPTNVKGVLGSFIVNPFQRYKDLHESCRVHVGIKWHQISTKSAKSFTDSVPVDAMMVSGHQYLINENKKILTSIISIILFCGTHDLPLRGKQQNSGKCCLRFSYILSFSTINFHRSRCFL